MHFTPWPFWARIVSTATVVLPVLRSPMISSRCPRPIGVMASMALMPVCSGSCTGWRPTMPGACTSSRRSWLEFSGPLPSMAWPSAFTTRPISASPTGTERMRPVALTEPPSSTWLASPRMTAPIDASSRFSARPRVPPSNSSTSLTDVSGSPATRAMPSPTSSTWPTLAESSEGVNVETCAFSAAAISSTLMVSSAIWFLPAFFWLDLFAELVEAVADRSVDDQVAHLGDDATHDLGVDDDLHLDVLARGPAEGVAQPLDVLVTQRHRAADLGDLVRALGNRELHELVDDVLELSGSARHHHGEHQRLGGGERLALHQVLDHRHLAGDGQVRIGEREAQLL